MIVGFVGRGGKGGGLGFAFGRAEHGGEPAVSGVVRVR